MGNEDIIDISEVVSTPKPFVKAYLITYVLTSQDNKKRGSDYLVYGTNKEDAENKAMKYLFEKYPDCINIELKNNTIE